MLSQISLVKARNAIESMYNAKCTVIEHQKVKLADKSTKWDEVKVLEDIPCKLSFKSITATTQTDSGASSVVQVTKLIVSPDVVIKAGSKVVVTQNGVTTEYQSSGTPARYNTHQEIVLNLFERWA